MFIRLFFCIPIHVVFQEALANTEYCPQGAGDASNIRLRLRTSKVSLEDLQLNRVDLVKHGQQAIGERSILMVIPLE